MLLRTNQSHSLNPAPGGAESQGTPQPSRKQGQRLLTPPGNPISVSTFKLGAFLF